MADLVPARFSELVTRLYLESQTQDAIFTLPRNKWFRPEKTGPSLNTRFHGQPAGNPSGPAAGPHTQMAQNILLSYIAGGRVMELKTVQVNDHIKISRPCIDMAAIGYNVEWSQELSIEQSLREYVAGMMLVEMFRRGDQLGGPALAGADGDVIFDMSLGYDLDGIRSAKLQPFLDGMRDASRLVERLRDEIPSKFAAARDLSFPSCISSSVTLSTFHGCPADEIERICQFLLNERRLNVIVKMNPPMLGRERLEHLLHDVLGYTELSVNPAAYESGLQLQDAVELVQRMMTLARQRGLHFGCKFSNTLEVLNHGTFFTPDNKVQYLSGQPLHVITMALTEAFRRAVGPAVPISFSAGVDKRNFADAVACGFVPVTVCTDLLRPGGYGRLPAYMQSLADTMRAVSAADLDEYILDAFGHRDEAHRLAARSGETPVQWASLLNTTTVAQRVASDPRYHAHHNRKAPPRIDSHLTTFDCISCEKCIPVCPNAANFTYPTPKVAFDYRDIIVSPSGDFRPGDRHRFEIDQELQIANFADFCNQCGNCDTFCPEYGGPYIKKPSFYGSEESWLAAAPRDGFFVRCAELRVITGRVRGRCCRLECDDRHGTSTYDDGTVLLTVSHTEHQVLHARTRATLTSEHRVDMGLYHTLRYLLNGVLDKRVISQINVATS